MANGEGLATPAVGLGPDDEPQIDPQEALDYLEVRCVCNDGHTVSISAVENMISVGRGEEEDDFSEEDAELEDVLGQIEAAFNHRKKKLGTAYPFEMDETGRLVRYCPVPANGPQPYVACLLVSYTTRFGYLGSEAFRETRAHLRQRVFQILATLALVGYAGRSAVSLGWPRREQETLLAALHRAWEWGSHLQPKAAPGHFANPDAKDGGVDVFGWSQIVGNEAVPDHYWGQAASGNNWKSKPVKPDADEFVRCFIDGHTVNNVYATIIPFDRNSGDRDHVYQEGRHGKIIDRMTLPKYYAAAIEIASGGQQMDEVDHVTEVDVWIERMTALLRSA